MPKQPEGIKKTILAENTSIQYGVKLSDIKMAKETARKKHEENAIKKEIVEISDENIKIAWDEAMQLIAADKVVFRSALQESTLQFKPNEIQIHANHVAIDFLKTERNKLLDFFKRFYQNEKMNVLFISKVEEASKGEKVLSTKEIFEQMATKNPYLRVLKDSLNMDFEY